MRRYDTESLNTRCSLVDLVGQDVALRKVAGTDGGEYAGPCPKCGGEDRFHCTATWWFCRQCHEQRGDAIEFLRWRDSLSFTEACAQLGGALSPVTDASTKRPSPRVPDAVQPPGDVWQARAREFVAYAEGELWGDVEALSYLRGRGLDDTTIRAAHLGHNPRKVYDDPARWGLEGAGEYTSPKRVYIPVGWVIPCERDGVIHYIKVRQPQGDPKYRAIRGSRLTLYGLDDLRGRTDAILVEGEFDALLLRQPVGDLCGVAATGSATKGLDADAIAVLCGVRRVFAAFDSDEAGQKGAQTLAGLSARVRMIPTPCGEHDVTDAWRADCDLRAWAVSHIGPDDLERRVAWLAHHLQTVGDDPLREALRAERRAGELLIEMGKAKPSGSNQYEDRPHDDTDPPTLADMGISKTQSSRWQKVAEMGLEPVERLARDRGGEWHEIPAPDWAPPDLTGGRYWYASDDDQLASIA